MHTNHLHKLPYHTKGRWVMSTLALMGPTRKPTGGVDYTGRLANERATDLLLE